MKILDYIYGNLIIVNYKKVINTKLAPQAIGAYSQAVKSSGCLFSSGQIPLVPESGNIISNKIDEQIEQIFKNIRGILNSEELDLNNIIKLTVFLIDLNDFDILNKIFNEKFGDYFPARSVIEVSRLPKDSKVEIEFIASYE